MLKREWGAESNGKLPPLFIPSKTATKVPEFAMEDLPLGRIAALVPEFAVKDLPVGRTLMMMMNFCVCKIMTLICVCCSAWRGLLLRRTLSRRQAQWNVHWTSGQSVLQRSRGDLQPRLGYIWGGADIWLSSTRREWSHAGIVFPFYIWLNPLQINDPAHQNIHFIHHRISRISVYSGHRLIWSLWDVHDLIILSDW